MQNALQVHTPGSGQRLGAYGRLRYQALEEAGLKIKRGEEGHVYYTSLSGEPPAVSYMEEGYTDRIFVIPADTAGQAIFGRRGRPCQRRDAGKRYVLYADLRRRA